MIVEDFLKTITEEISNMISTKTVIGEHIIVEDKTIIPVTKVTFGFGSGGGEGKGKSGEEGTGGGGGGGGSISPVAFLVVTAQDVQLFTVKGKGALARLAEVMPEMMESCSSMMEEKTKEKSDEPES
jgi:sporulation protein YtfJ